jgi:hypothetical protein
VRRRPGDGRTWRRLPDDARHRVPRSGRRRPRRAGPRGGRGAEPAGGRGVWRPRALTASSKTARERAQSIRTGLSWFNPAAASRAEVPFGGAARMRDQCTGRVSTRGIAYSRPITVRA